ncbi:putative transcriptional activator [Hibiscus syriacus]|uniref:Transcriptional activator n=1 Tax=Hibiscus syriacus TaxID=106335 RepID=A0A6A2XBT0_HIBSY|nr:putative transcriptional activator [Hibiscus syriacus]
MASPNHQGESPSSSSSSASKDWWRRILIPTILAGVAGGGFGLVSKHRKIHGLANISATYATNFAIVTGCYCGAREFVTATLKSAKFALLSPLHDISFKSFFCDILGGQFGAYRYSLIFAVVGTAVDFTALKLRPKLRHIGESMFDKSGSLKLPEWSPIQVLDDEALAAKHAREEKLHGQRKTLDKEKL